MLPGAVGNDHEEMGVRLSGGSSSGHADQDDLFCYQARTDSGAVFAIALILYGAANRSQQGRPGWHRR
jgi:hypothetical protein